MADKTSLPELEFINLPTPDKPRITLLSDSLKGDGTYLFSSAIATDTAGTTAPTLEMLLTFKNTEGKFMQVSVPAAGFTSTTTVAGAKRGIAKTGIDLETEDSDLDIDLLTGSEVVSAIPAQLFQLLYDAGRQQIASSAKWDLRPLFTGSGLLANRIFANATARDAAITSPANGDMCYLTDTGVMNQFIGGAWTTFATGTTPNGSTTVAGKYEEATVAEQGTATATGGSGARLVPANANLVKTSSGAGDENKLAVLNASGQLAAGFVDALKESDLAAKGDLISASAANTKSILSVGANNTILVADNGETTGQKWSTYPFNSGSATTSTDTTRTAGGSFTFDIAVGAADFTKFHWYYRIHIENSDPSPDRNTDQRGEVFGVMGDSRFKKSNNEEVTNDAQNTVVYPINPSADTSFPSATNTSGGDVITVTVTAIAMSGSNVRVSYTVGIAGTPSSYTVVVTNLSLYVEK